MNNTTQSNTTAVPLTCVPLNLTLIPFCSPDAPQFIPSTLNVSFADTTAQSAFTMDASRWVKNAPCQSQADSENATMCNNCLAIRARWQCALAFPTCTASDNLNTPPTVNSACQSLCEKKNARCDETEDCSQYATTQCSDAPTTESYRRRTTTTGLALMTLIAILVAS